MAAAILLPASLGVLHAEGLLLTEADGAHTVGGDAQRHEILLDGVGTAIAEAEVVFGGAALVAMTFDGDFDRRVLLQEVRSRRERRTSVRTNVGLVVVKVGVTHSLVKIRLGSRRRRRWRRSSHVYGGRGAGGAAGACRSHGVGRRVGRRDLG